MDDPGDGASCPTFADFGEGRLEAEALAALEPPLPEDGLFGVGALLTALEPTEPPEPLDASDSPTADGPAEP